MHDRNRVTFDLTSRANAAAVGHGVPLILSVTAAKRTIATIAALSLFIGACASDQENETSDAIANTSSTTTTIEATTTTAATTTTTLSEQDEAEAEVEQLVIDWWTSPIDSSLGEDEPGLEYLTGLIRKRTIDNNAALTDAGQVMVGNGNGPIEITDIRINPETGQGELDACTGDDSSVLDSETGEEVGEVSDPSFAFTSEFLVELTDDGWKIHEWYPSYNTGDPIECTIETE